MPRPFFRAKGEIMSNRNDVQDWVVAALMSHAGKASLIDVAEYVWINYRSEIERARNLLYTWQYEVRWAASSLRKRGIMKPNSASPKGVWELS